MRPFLFKNPRIKAMMMLMKMDQYQKEALKTALYLKKHKFIYAALGLGNEAGEVLGKVKKWLRGDDGKKGMSKERKLALKDEIGDVLWYVAVLAAELNLNLSDVAEANLSKLKSRMKRGVLHGDGDKR